MPKKPRKEKYCLVAEIHLEVTATSYAEAEQIARNTDLSTWCDFEITSVEKDKDLNP